MSRPSPWVLAAASQLAMELRLTLRRGENLLVMLVIPLLALLFFGSVDVLPKEGDRPVDFLLPGCLALAIIATSFVNLGIATAYERNYGVLKRLGGSPVGRGSLVAAKIAAVLIVEVVQAALLVVTAAGLLGWTPPPDTSVGVVLGAVTLGTITFAGLGLLLAGTLRAEATLAATNGLFLVALLVGGVVVPLGELPDAIAALSRTLPAAALSDLLRVGFGSAGDATGPLLVLGAWAFGGVSLAIRFFRWE